MAFEVEGALYALPEADAVKLAQELRLRAGAEDDVPGVDEAAWVADLIEDTLVGARDGPLVLEDDVAEAVFYVLDSTIENPKGEAYRLYLALRALHHELEEL